MRSRTFELVLTLGKANCMYVHFYCLGPWTGAPIFLAPPPTHHTTYNTHYRKELVLTLGEADYMHIRDDTDSYFRNLLVAYAPSSQCQPAAEGQQWQQQQLLQLLVPGFLGSPCPFVRLPAPPPPCPPLLCVACAAAAPWGKPCVLPPAPSPHSLVVPPPGPPPPATPSQLHCAPPKPLSPRRSPLLNSTLHANPNPSPFLHAQTTPPGMLRHKGRGLQGGAPP